MEGMGGGKEGSRSESMILNLQRFHKLPALNVMNVMNDWNTTRKDTTSNLLSGLAGQVRSLGRTTGDL